MKRKDCLSQKKYNSLFSNLLDIKIRDTSAMLALEVAHSMSQKPSCHISDRIEVTRLGTQPYERENDSFQTTINSKIYFQIPNRL